MQTWPLRYIFDPISGELTYSADTRGLMFKTLRKIEEYKVPLFYRLAHTTLQSDPKRKVILYLNYLDGIRELAVMLKEYNPLILIGEVSAAQRRFADCPVPEVQ